MTERLCCLVGFNALHRTILANVINLFRAKGRIVEWSVAESWLPGATILVCDTDTAEGRHAWEWCGANGVPRVAVTASPDGYDDVVIAKPLCAADLQILIDILNEVATAPAPKAPQVEAPASVATAAGDAPPATADHGQTGKEGKPSLRLAWSQPEPAPTPPPPPANVVHLSPPGGMVASHIVVQGTSHRVVVYNPDVAAEASPAAAVTAPETQRIAQPEARVQQPVVEPPPVERPAVQEPPIQQPIIQRPVIEQPAKAAPAEPTPAAHPGSVPPVSTPPVSAPPTPVPPASVTADAAQPQLPDALRTAHHPDPESLPVVDLPSLDLREFLNPASVAPPHPGQEKQSTPPPEPDVALEAFVPSSRVGQFKEPAKITAADDDRIRMILLGLKAEEKPVQKDDQEDLATVLARLKSIRQPAVLYFDRIEPICVATVENQFYTKASLREIYDVMALQSGPARTSIAATVSSGTREAGCYSEAPQHIKRLAWIASLRSRMPDVAQFEGRAYKLRQWPDLVQLPHDPRHMQWCGLLTRRPITPAALAEANDASPLEVATFLTACGELGILERTKMSAEASAKVEEPRTEKARERVNIFRSLLERLGFRR